MEWGNVILIAAAGTGAVLGVINTVWALSRDRVRLRVAVVWETDEIPMEDGTSVSRVTSYPNGLEANPGGRLGVKITNVGLTEVTLTSAGVTKSCWLVRNWIKSKFLRMSLLGDAKGVVRLPHRLASRESVTIWSAKYGSAIDAKLSGAKRVYASTACGIDAFGTSRLLRSLVREAERLSQRRGTDAYRT